MDEQSGNEEKLVILMAHGSRHPEGERQAESLMDEVRKRCQFPTEKAYLEILEPGLETLVERMVPKKKKFFILPLLIFRGGHALRDIPEMVSRCRKSFPAFHFHVGPVLEPHGKILDFWVDFAKEWLLANASGQIILLGRGAKDEEAKKAFDGVVQSVENDLGTNLLTAFTGLQEPSLVVAMESLNQEQPILILPCLLFDGVLLENSRKQVEGWNVTWAPTLANSPVLVDQVLDVIEEGMREF